MTSRRRCFQLTAEQLAHLVAEYQAGSTVYELAAQFSISRATVSQHLKRQGIELRLKPPTDDLVDEMVRLYKQGLSLAATGARVGYDAHTVQKYLRTRGVPMRDTQGRVVSSGVSGD